MDGNQRKLRNLLLYIGIPVVVLFIIILLFNNRVPQTAAYKYSDILDYFQSQEVTGYRLNLGTGDMAIQLESGETIGYQLPRWTCSTWMCGIPSSSITRNTPTAKWCRISSAPRKPAG